MAADDVEAGAVATSRRVLCLTGPESTGKTTLAEALARETGAVLVEEVARRFLAGRTRYEAEDVLTIARLQFEAETAALSTDAPLVVCDTDVTVIQIWWEEKFGALPEALVTLLAARTERAYLLMAPDIAWAPDPLRENPEDRERLFARYQALLAGGPFPYETIAGEGAARLKAAMAALRALIPDRVPERVPERVPDGVPDGD